MWAFFINNTYASKSPSAAALYAATAAYIPEQVLNITRILILIIFTYTGVFFFTHPGRVQLSKLTCKGPSEKAPFLEF